MPPKAKKIFTAVTLFTFLLSALPARAQLFPVPTYSSGGTIDSTGRLVDDTTADIHEIIRAGTIAALNSAFQAFSDKLNETIESKLGIQNTLYYQEALIESKYFVDSLKKDGGKTKYEEACEVDAVECVAAVYQLMPVNYALSRAQAAALGASRQLSGEDYNTLIIGATSQYASSIACGGIDNQAVDNTARLLAAAHAGVLPQEINPKEGARYYQQLARLGHPLSNPEVWKQQFEDNAARAEAQARAAAALEISSPGLKAPQSLSSGGGGLRIGRTVSLISVGQQNAQNAVFNIGVKGADSLYNTSSFKAFIFSLLADFGAKYLGALIGGVFGGAAGLLGFDVSGEVAEKAEPAARAIGASVATTFGVALYERVSKQLFQGEVLAESTGCRSGAAARAGFSPSDSLFELPDQKIDAFDNGGRGATFLNASPNPVQAGGTISLAWVATAAGSGSTVTLSGGRFGTGTTVGLTGTDTDNVSQETTYILSAVNSETGYDDSVTVTVTLGTDTGGGGSRLGCADPALACQPGDPTPPQFKPDNVNFLKNNVIWLHGGPEVAEWNVDVTLDSVRITPGEICLNHPGDRDWPVFADPVEADGNPWVFAAINDQWYAGTFEWLRPDQKCKRLDSDPDGSETGTVIVISDKLGPGVKQSPMATWKPAAGEQVYFMLSTRARDGGRTSDERSTIIGVTWPAGN